MPWEVGGHLFIFTSGRTGPHVICRMAIQDHGLILYSGNTGPGIVFRFIGTGPVTVFRVVALNGSITIICSIFHVALRVITRFSYGTDDCSRIFRV